MKYLNKYMIFIFLILFLNLISASTWEEDFPIGNLIVSQPIQVTENDYYERGQSVVYDGSNYWMFYGRSDSVTGNYGNSNPDIKDYKIYYKKSSTIEGLISSTPNYVTGADNIYQGQTSSVYYGGKVWVFAADETTNDNSIKAWYSDNDGASFTEIDSSIDGSGAPHLWATVYDNKIFLAYNAIGGKIRVATYDGSWSSPEDVTTHEGIPRLFVDSSQNLQLIAVSWGMPAYYIHTYDSSWSTTPDYSIDGTIYDDSDPALFQIGGDGDYSLIYAPWDGTKQYLSVYTSESLTGLETAESHTITEGGYMDSQWVDMWPTVLSNNEGDYLFFTSERNNHGTDNTGNIWYMKIDWDTHKNHHTFINPALEDSSDDDIIRVGEGTFYEQINLDKEISLIGTGFSNSTVIITSGYSAINITSDNVVLEGFDIQFNGTHAISVMDADNVEIKNNRINTTLDGSLGIWVCGSFNGCGSSINLDIINNTILIEGVSTGIYSDFSSPRHHHWLILGNTFDSGGVNLELYDVSNADVINNTFFGKGNSVSIVYSSELSDVSDSRFYNNTFLGNGDIAGVTPTFWIESDFSTSDGNTKVHDIEIIGNDFYNWINAGIKLGEPLGSGIFNNIDDVVINHNGFYYGSGQAIQNNILDEIVNGKFNWWGNCNGPGPVGPGTGSEVSVNVTYHPWLGVCITNKTYDLCAMETDNLTLSADLILSEVDTVWFSYVINGSYHNKTAVKGSENSYYITIPSSELVGGMNISWNVFANDSVSTYNNSWIDFYIRKSTVLKKDPEIPDGENSWYVSEPEFSLVKDNAGNKIYYQWDSDDIFPYTIPFGLENIPNPPNISAGILELNWWTDFGVCGNETKQTEIFHIDLVNPVITDLYPENNSVITNYNPVISAYLDEIWQSNSGINKSTINMYVDGELVYPDIINADSIDAIVKYNVTGSGLSVGIHNVSIILKDNSGRVGQINWFFEVDYPTTSFDFSLFSPDNLVYDSRRIPFNLTTNEVVDKVEFMSNRDSRPRWKTLCRNCDEYGYFKTRIKSLKEGENNISIRAVYDGVIEIVNKSFIVDSRLPKISRIEPRRNKVINGSEFIVRYTEENLQNITLVWNDTKILEGCESGRNKECKTSVNLSDYDGEEIEFYFEVSDLVNTVKSKITKVKVDTTSPNLTVYEPINDSNNGRRVIFNITSGEDVKLQYMDLNSSRPRWKRVCSNCDEYGYEKEKKKSFKRGEHTLLIKAEDKAGNSDYKVVLFSVDY